MVALKVSSFLAPLHLLWLWPGSSAAFRFGGDKEPVRRIVMASRAPEDHFSGQPQAVPAITFTDKYTVALDELQELESQPLCHRTAARLLVNNCQVLDGKDEATILTDSGRQIRDFVDAYAASLAICDLERGSFSIPPACAKFRESALSQLPVPSRAFLHVSSRDIDSCLSGLARSDSAWSTWISYRHKSLRFCDAARADHEKAQNIRVYQRITKILNNLANGVDLEVEERLSAVDKRAKDIADGLDRLPTQIDQLWQKLAKMDTYLSGGVLAQAEASGLHIKNSVEATHNLHQMLAVVLQTVLNYNAEVAAAQDQAVELATQRINTGMELVMATIATALTSSASLQEQIDESRSQAAELAHKQQVLGTNLDSMLLLAEGLSTQYIQHQQHLDQSRAKSEAILGTLHKAGDSAEALQNSIPGRGGLFGIWPYVICPAATLMMGSYGLPPSVFRNMGLIAMGEFAGYFVSLANTRSFSPLASLAPWLARNGHGKLDTPGESSQPRPLPLKDEGLVLEPEEPFNHTSNML